MLFYPADYLVGTLHFTYEQKGRYIDLLCFQHQHGEIPAQHFNQVCNEDPLIKTKFFEQKNGTFVNKRLLDEMKKRQLWRNSRIQNLKGKRLTKELHMDDHMGKHMDVRMENVNDNENSLKEIKEDNKISNINIKAILSKYANRRGLKFTDFSIKQFYGRYTNSAKVLFKLAGDTNSALEAIEYLSGVLEDKKLSWTLETFTKPEWWQEYENHRNSGSYKAKKALEQHRKEQADAANGATPYDK